MHRTAITSSSLFRSMALRSRIGIRLTVLGCDFATRLGLTRIGLRIFGADTLYITGSLEYP